MEAEEEIKDSNLLVVVMLSQESDKKPASREAGVSSSNLNSLLELAD